MSSATTLDGEHERAAVASAVDQAKRWYLQRISAMVLSLCVLVHLGVIVFAVRGGLSAAEILGRTRGSWGWGAFYMVFVIAAVAHVPIGLATIGREWCGLSERTAWRLARLFGLVLLVVGLRAVYAVVVP